VTSILETFFSSDPRYFAAAYFLDAQSFAPLAEHHWTPPEGQLAALDPDVHEERDAVLADTTRPTAAGSAFTLRLAQVLKLFPTKAAGAPPFAALKSLSLGLHQGEVFCLMGTSVVVHCSLPRPPT